MHREGFEKQPSESELRCQMRFLCSEFTLDASAEVLHHALSDQLQEEPGLRRHIVHGLEVHGSHAEIVKIVQRCSGLIEVIPKACQADFITQMGG